MFAFNQIKNPNKFQFVRQKKKKFSETDKYFRNTL